MVELSDYIRIKLKPETKKQFFDYCKAEGVIPSEVLRRFCDQFCSGSDLIVVKDLKGEGDA